MRKKKSNSIGYFVAISIRSKENGYVCLDACRATRSERLTMMQLRIDQHLLDMYVQLKRRAGLPDFPVIIRAIVKKVPASHGGYDVELVPLIPDRVTKVASMFLCEDSSKLLRTLRECGLIEDGLLPYQD